MTQSDERKILDYLSTMAQRFLVTEEGVKKRELCYQLLVGCLVLFPIAINQAVSSEQLMYEHRKNIQDLEKLAMENHELKREIMQLKEVKS